MLSTGEVVIDGMRLLSSSSGLEKTSTRGVGRRSSRAEMVATGWGAAAALSPLLLLPTCSSSDIRPPPSSPLLPPRSRTPLHRRRSTPSSSSSSSPSPSFPACCLRSPNPASSSLSRTTHRFFPPQLPLPNSPHPHPHPHLLCRAAEYKFPDPIPEFADAETDKFRTHMLARLTEKNQYFGDFVEEIVGICTEILSSFLHAEYGGPGTLLVIPFIDMADTIREKGLPGAPQAARAAVWWAEKHIDKDWKEWTGDRG